MTIAIQELLDILCPGATPTRGTELQKAYLIPDAVGAKLAYEVLTAYGFDAKLYPDASAMKLYITMPPAGDEAEQKFITAQAHAHTLAAIRKTLDADAGITFVNAPGGKQVVIQFVSSEAEAIRPAMASPLPTAAQAASAALPRTASKKAKKAEDAFKALSGPAVGKGDLFAGERKDGFFRQIYLYVRGNIATGVGAFFMLVIVPALIAFSLFAMTKFFLCRDFAISKYEQNHAWYCDGK